MPWNEKLCNWLKCMLIKWAMLVIISSPWPAPTSCSTATAEIIARLP